MQVKCQTLNKECDKLVDLNERINKENNALLAQVFKINNDLQKAWSLWHYFHNYGFYMGCTNGPTVETSGSIVLAPQPSEVGLGTSEVWPFHVICYVSSDHCSTLLGQVTKRRRGAARMPCPNRGYSPHIGEV